MFNPIRKHSWGVILGTKAQKTQDHRCSCGCDFGSINLQMYGLEAAFTKCTALVLM